MLAKRLMVATMVLLLLAGCGSDPVRDSDGPQTGQQPISTQGTSSGSNTSSGDSGTSGGGGFGNINIPNIDGRVLLGIIVVVVVVVSAVAIYHLASTTIDSIRHHTQPASKDSTEAGIYRDPQGLFSVAIPGEYPAHGPGGIEARQIADMDHSQVFFITAKDDDPVYGVSVQPLAAASDAQMPLVEFATKVYPPSTSVPGDPPATQMHQPAFEQEITLDGKPALFREYAAGVDPDHKYPLHYLLYFVRDDKRSAVLSITWPKDCPMCAAGPEAGIRSMDPELKKFVDSFHLMDAAPAH